MRGARSRAQTDPVARASRRPAPVHAAATGILYFDGVYVYIYMYVCMYLYSGSNHSIVSINNAYRTLFRKSPES